LVLLALVPAWWLVRLLLRGLTWPSLIRSTVKVTAGFERIVQQEVTAEQWTRICTRFYQEFPTVNQWGMRAP
jgi:hypothetical protein